MAPLALALPASGLASKPSFQFGFDASHGYSLVGTVAGGPGETGISFELIKGERFDKNVYTREVYGFGVFPATYRPNAHTRPRRCQPSSGGTDPCR